MERDSEYVYNKKMKKLAKMITVVEKPTEGQTQSEDQLSEQKDQSGFKADHHETEEENKE